MSQQSRNILVTGGAGFLGSHLCDYLLRDEAVNVICVDNYLTGSERNIDDLLANPRFVFIRHDITDPLDLESVPELSRFHVSLHGVHELYHLACPTSPKEQLEHPMETLLANSHGTYNMLAVAVRWRAKFLLASASAVYGDLDEVQGVTEDTRGYCDQLGPRAPYEEGKRFAETLTSFMQKGHPFQPRVEETGVHLAEAEEVVGGAATATRHTRWAAIARIFATYGPRMKPDDGRLIPDLVREALANEPLVVHGEESWQMSLCFVEDVVTALVKCMQVLPEKPVNLGSPHPVLVKDVAEKIIAFSGATSSIIFDPKTPYVRPSFVPDISRAKEELDWFPVVSLDDGLKETIEAMRAEGGAIKEFSA